MSLIDNDYQTALLFKQFVGVAAARLDDEFSVEKFRSVPNIFSNDVMIEEIPTSAPFKISGANGLDASANWIDSSCNYGNNSIEESIYFDPSGSVNNGKTFAEIYPDTHLKFYKRLSLVPCEQNSNGRVWGSFTDYSGVTMYANKQSVLKHAIPFKYDDIDATYSPVVRYNRIQGSNGAGTGNDNFQETAINSFPLYWVMDAGTGFLQFYQTQTNLENVGIKDIKDLSGVQEKEWAPEISLYVYNGKKGITNLDVSGQVQVGDISGLGSITADFERMILPDGSANPLIDLCGNDAIRAQYEYIRKNLFIGYPTQPIIDVSKVDHSQDPSHNSIYYELDVSGNSYISGDLQVNGIISGNTDVDISGNTNIDGDLAVDGIIESIDGTRFVDYRNFSSDISGSIMGVGNSEWFCIAKIDPAPAGETANGLFILDDDTSGLRQTIVFRAGSSYSRGNFIDVISNNSYGERIKDIRIDVSANSYYAGANLYINRSYTTNATRLFVRVYQNKRKGNPSDGTNIGYWQLTNTPVPNLLETRAQLNLEFQPGGILSANKATTLDTFIDAELKVNGNTTLTNVVATDISARDISGRHISATGNVTIGGDLSVQGYTTIQNGQFVDVSGMNLVLREELDIKDTNILVKNDTPEIYQPTGAPNNPDYYEIAFINKSSVPPGTGNDVDCVTAYFTITNNLASGALTDSKQSIHFIAGIYYTASDPVSFIKVLSNNYNPIDTHISHLVIAEDTSADTAYLIIGFNNQSSTTMEKCEIRMYKNSNGEQMPSPSTYNGGGWVLGNRAFGAGTNGLLDIAHISVYPNSPYTSSSITTVVKIDQKSPPNAYSTLYESFLRDVDISANLRVGTNLNVNGNTQLDGSLTVDGITTLNDKTRARDISCAYLQVDVSGSENGGIIINNTGSGGPEIKFQRTDTSYLGNTRYNKIYTDDPTNYLHIDFGTGTGAHTLYLDGNTNSTTSVVAQNLNSGDTIIQSKIQNGLTLNWVASNSGRGKVTLNNGFNSGSINGGIDIFASGTPSPQHDWYIGSTTLGEVGGAIRLKGLTETGGAFSTFQSGEVRINAQDAGSGYQDIDFAINTLDISNAFLVDAALNQIIFDVSATIPTIIGPTTISGETIINGNTTINGDTSTNGNFSNTGVAILNDLSFSNLFNNFAELPSETTIPYRKHQTTGSSPYRNLKVDGYSEYSFTTGNLNNDATTNNGDWITIARVGYQDMVSQSQRADGIFEITCNNSGTHQTIRLAASHHYKKGMTLDVIKNITYGLNSLRHIRAARMSYAGLYDGGVLQIQITQTTYASSYTDSAITVKLYKNNNYFGWGSDLSGAPFPDNTPSGYSQSGYPGTGNLLYNGSTYSNFTLFFPSETGIKFEEHYAANGNPGQSVLQYTSDMIFNKVYMKDDLDMSGNSILNTSFPSVSSVTTDTLTVNDNFNLPRDTISNMVSQLSNYSLGIATDVGKAGNASYQRDSLIWRSQEANSVNYRILTSEQYIHIYSRQLNGNSTYGGLTAFSKGSTVTLSGYDYSPYTAPFTNAASYARIGMMPTANDGTPPSSRSISSFLHFMRKTWITSIYLNTPFNPISSGSGNLFQWGFNSYVDIQIKNAGAWESVYRIGNPQNGVYDSYGFPSSTSYIDSNGGVRLTFPADEWKYIEAGTNMSDVVRFNFYAGVSSTPCVWIIDEYASSGWHQAEVDGYITIVQEHPLAT